MRRSLFWCTMFVLVFCATNCLTAQNDQELVTAGKDTDLLIRAADARLRLAQADLEIALDSNRRAPGHVSGLELKRLEANIEVAQKQLGVTKQFSHGSAYPNQLFAAQATADLAQQDHRSALRVNKRRPGTIPKTVVNRLKIKAELANIRLELWKDPEAYMPSMMHEMQWQIDRLTEQVIELSQRLDAEENAEENK
jgi:hypothetical protein